MIEFTRGYSFGGQIYPTLEDAQVAAMEALLIEIKDEMAPLRAAKHISQNSAKFLNILTMTETSRPKARAINGGTKKRRPKTPPTANEQETAEEKALKRDGFVLKP